MYLQVNRNLIVYGEISLYGRKSTEKPTVSPNHASHEHGEGSPTPKGDKKGRARRKEIAQEEPHAGA